jgi:hypothetical protein
MAFTIYKFRIVRPSKLRNAWSQALPDASLEIIPISKG